MNNKGIKFLALAAVLAIALASFVVISDGSESDAAGEVVPLNGTTPIATITTNANIEPGHAYFINTDAAVTLTVPESQKANATMEHPIILFIKGSSNDVTVKCDFVSEYDLDEGEADPHWADATFIAAYAVKSSTADSITLVNDLKPDNKDDGNFIIGAGWYNGNGHAKSTAGDIRTWIRNDNPYMFRGIDDTVYIGGNFNYESESAVVYGTGNGQNFYDANQVEHLTATFTFVQFTGTFKGDAHWEAVAGANQSYSIFTMKSFNGTATSKDGIFTITSWTSGDITVTKAVEDKDVVLSMTEIPADSTLTVNQETNVWLKNGSTLKLSGTLVNNGYFVNEGTINIYGEYTGTQKGEMNTMVTVPKVSGATVTPQGGLFAVGKVITRTGEGALNPIDGLTIAVDQGYEFGGWTVAKASDGSAYAGETVPLFGIVMTPQVTKPSNYTVTFMDDAIPLFKQSVESGKMAVKPADPTKDNNRFTGWYTTNPNIDPQAKKYDFAQPVTKSFELYAGWNAICTVSVPANVEGKFTTDHPGDNEVNLGTTHTFVLTVTPWGEHVITVAVSNGDLSHDGNLWTIANIDSNVSVSISATKDGVKETKTEQKIENVDGSVTESTVTTTESAGAATVIGESAKTGGAEPVTTTATVSATEATVDVGAAGKNAVITETMSDAIREAVATSGAAANSLTVEVTAEDSNTVSMPKDLLHDANVKEISVTLDGATIVMPKTAVAEADMADTISLSVTDAGQAPAAAIPEGATATEAFDLTLGGSNTSQFVGTVKVTLTMELPAGATNVKFLCVGGEGAGQSYNASAVTGDSVSGDLPHFSTWTIIFTLPADVNVDDGDELPPIWQYVPQQQAEDDHTTIIVAACAAACAVIAVILVIANIMRKS